MWEKGLPRSKMLGIIWANDTIIQRIHDFEISTPDVAVMLNSKKPLFRGNEYLLLRDSSAKEEPKKKNKHELVLVSYNPQLHLSFEIMCCCLGGAGGRVVSPSKI